MNTTPVNFRLSSPKTQLSARKLAARLWHFRVLPEASKVHSNKLIVRERKLIRDSVISLLLSQLLRSQTSIRKLDTEIKSSKKKLHKTRSMLERETRSRQRMESFNAKLLRDIAQTKLYAKQIMVHYEEEKRERKLLEELCNELALRIIEDKAKLEGLQRYSMKICEEMEEERNMFQMAELWREESIQMKLVDAKLALEDKYNQMIHLIAHLQSFLGSRDGEGEPNTMDLRDMQFIKQVAESFNFKDFTKSNDVFSIYQDLRKGKVNERVIEPDYPINPSSTVHIVCLDEDCQKNNNSVLHQSSTSSDLESVTDFCSSTQGRGTSLDNVKNLLGSEERQPNSEEPTFDKCEKGLATSSIQTEGGFRQWEGNFAEYSVNPHITRGMKGCIEWPRGIPRSNSRVVPLEERVRKQKSQLQHILKPQA
ncbi:hypothetical protein RJT34_32095 [Clitoria ternatea]|uniref:Uncharacterized protein n=1 Tax=Clitoria ternatea TaxID=43366 RepID=A0AAN9EW94_CLITE